MRPILIITALMSEAMPLVEQWGLKPIRNIPLLERFQTFAADGRYIAVSGIGKLKSATATAVLTTALAQEHGPLLVNIGLAGATHTHGERGDLFVINKVRDVTTNTRFYPDIIVRHSVRESALDTHDHPVTTPPTEPVLVDMEASGFMQAATSLVSPSSTLILKVISDGCNGERITPTGATSLIKDRLNAMQEIIASWQAELAPAPTLDHDEQRILEQIITTVRFSQTQRVELARTVLAFKLRGGAVCDTLAPYLQHQSGAKHARRELFDNLMNSLRGAELP
jgi:adenosylhomocysteine nucleosidase